MKNNKLIIFDTTLRDGEQTPGATINNDEKLQIALQLEKLGVDVIEAGFAASSVGDFNAIKNIAEQVKKSTICSLARALDSDIKMAGESILSSNNNRIHTFIATSKIHMEHKLNMSEEEVIKRAVNAVKYASTFTNDVEFSCEDAGRSDIGFLYEIIDAVINAGAKTINLPDTVGFKLPHEIGLLVKKMDTFIGDRAIISVHNHNDLGLATANTLESISNGARQVECTINGIGERAGNAALEEIIMTLNTKKDFFKNIKTNIKTTELYPTSRLVSLITGITPQPNKAIIGDNAFSHESGIHQDGFLKNKSTYEIMNPKDIGITNNNSLTLGKLSGRSAFKHKIENLGFSLNDNEIEEAFKNFKNLADNKKEIYDDDIRAIIIDNMEKSIDIIEFIKIELSNNPIVYILNNGKEVFGNTVGKGVIDSIFKSIEKLSAVSAKLIDYNITSVTKGKESLAKSIIKLEINETVYIGTGVDIDIINASALSYISAINHYFKNK